MTPLSCLLLSQIAPNFVLLIQKTDPKILSSPTFSGIAKVQISSGDERSCRISRTVGLMFPTLNY